MIHKTSDSQSRQTSESLVPLPWHDRFEKCVENSRLTLLAGEPGVGKSYFTRHLARKLTGLDPVVIYGSPVTDVLQLFCHQTLTATETGYCDGPLPTALKQNRFLIIEEFALIPVEVRDELLALRSGESQLLNKINKEWLDIPEDFRCICVSNRENIRCRRGVEGLRALLTDFLIEVVPPPDMQTVRKFLENQFPEQSPEQLDRVIELFGRFRTVEDKEDSDKNPLTYRAAEKLMKLLDAGMTEHEAVTVALVNQFILDEDLHEAQTLKHNISD